MNRRSQACLMAVCLCAKRVVDPGPKPNPRESQPALTSMIHFQQLADTWQHLLVGFWGLMGSQGWPWQ